MKLKSAFDKMLQVYGRKFPINKGKHRIARRLMKYFDDDERMTTYSDGIKIWVNTKKIIGSGIYYFGQIERATTKLFNQIAVKNTVFLISELILGIILYLPQVKMRRYTLLSHLTRYLRC